MNDRQTMTIPEMQNLAKQFRTEATRCEEMGTFLGNLSSTMFWKSKAASSFSQNMADYIKVLSQFRDGFRAVAGNIDRRVTKLNESDNV